MDRQLKRKQNIFVLRVSANAHNPLVVMLSGGGSSPNGIGEGIRGGLFVGKPYGRAAKMSAPVQREQVKRSAQRAFHLLSAPLEGEVPAEQGKGGKS